MTPLHLINRQTLLGYVFLLLGLLIVLLAGAPILIALRAHTAPPPVTVLFLVFLLIGILVAIFGAWLVPNSGTSTAFTQFVVAAGPLLNRIPGLSRVGDPKPPLPPESP